MHTQKNYFTFLIALIGLNFNAQTFEVEQIEQLFRPRLKVDTKYIFDSKFKDTTSTYNQKEANAVFTFPIKTKLGADVKLDLSSLKLKDILQNSVRVKASQTLGMIRVNARQANIGFDSLPQKNNYTLAAGILGASLTKKFRILFYSTNIAIAEQDKTLNKAVPRFSGLIGQLHIRGVKKNFFYGIGASYSDGLLVGSPFFGGSEPIGKHFVFNYTLPVQVNLQYKNNRTLVTAGVSADGYRTGMDYNHKRLNLNYTSAAAYASLRYKFSKTFVGKAEAGYVFYQNIRYTPSDILPSNFSINNGVYAQVTFNILFGQTIWEKVFDAVVKN
ncbi:MAG: hypothetical protein SFY56_11490 [Bacteroidota bacterium]|nr:hypothetical protein [Bacteroidota bacterium]